MTPFELSLENELNLEVPRFANEWLFKWHGMTYEGGKTDVDAYDGRRIHYAGIKYGHQQQQVFWGAVARYLNQKTHETFKRWDVETQTYQACSRVASIDGVERCLGRLVGRIISRSIDTDRALRGGGTPESVTPFDGTGLQAQAVYEINRLAESHRQLMRPKKVEEKSATLLERFSKPLEEFYANHKGLIWAGGAIRSGLSAAWRFFVGIKIKLFLNG